MQYGVSSVSMDVLIGLPEVSNVIDLLYRLSGPGIPLEIETSDALLNSLSTGEVSRERFILELARG